MLKYRQMIISFCHNTCVWQTDGRTDGRTDRRTDIQMSTARPCVCIRSRAVKMTLAHSTLSVFVWCSVPWQPAVLQNIKRPTVNRRYYVDIANWLRVRETGRYYCMTESTTSAQFCCIPCTVIDIFDCNCNDLELGHPRSKIMIPIESPLAISYLTSFESNIVSLAFLRYLTLKIFFHRSNGED